MNTGTVAPPDLSAALGAAAPRLHPLASPLWYFASVDSTNDVAAAWAATGAPHGAVVVAEGQMSGRGRGGRTWFSPPGAGLYVSIVLRPGRERAAGGGAMPPWTPLITLAAGVGLAEGIRAASGLPVQIKWPNDIVIADMDAPRAADRRWRKLAGILAEGATADGALQHVVLGYGINVRTALYPETIRGAASSLEQEAGRGVDRACVLVETLAALNARYRELADGQADAVLARWRSLAPASIGARVSWQRGGAPGEGLTAGIDPTGALLVRSRTGETLTLDSGEVTWL